ncbi:MAG: hypothetical protein AAFO74_13895 [Pseudomonadota bacterium]
MNDQDYPSTDTSYWGTGSASIDEMPPQDFEQDHEGGFDLTMKEFFIALAIGVPIFLLAFSAFA